MFEYFFLYRIANGKIEQVITMKEMMKIVK
jgi:hypothetical protein